MGYGKLLTLTVTEPDDGATVTESSVRVRGIVSDDKGVIVSRIFKIMGILLVVCLLALPLVACQGLTLRVTTPRDGATVTVPAVIVQGNVSDARATVMVNDVQVAVSKKTGFFKTTVNLTEGENIIKVVATKGKEAKTKTLAVTYRSSDEEKVEA